VRVTGAKLIAWWLMVAVSAMVGGVWAYYLTFIYPESAVDPLVMIGAVLMTFLGGRGTLWGPTIGALVLVPAQQFLLTELGASQLYLVGYAAVFMVVLLLLPRGILPSLSNVLAGLRERQRTRREPVVREEAAA
jgi:branched-chain amino acid transport system permease protein